MDSRIFLNNDVARITGVNARQVLSWTEKGLIVPFRETTGAGAKRGYDYVNLLEVCLCKKLFYIGMSFQRIKIILNNLRKSGTMNEWAQDFNNYYMKVHKNQMESLQERLNELAGKKGCEEQYKSLTETIEKYPAMLTVIVPDKPVGILMIFYRDEGETIYVIPWDMDYVMNLNMVKEDFTASDGFTVIDLGRIKSAVDSKL